jgi:predicted esterase
LKSLKPFQFEDHKAIPYLIGAIDAADSFETIRGIGAGIWELTNARDVFPSSEWWKKWWEENKKNYPEAVQNIPIPSVHDAWGTPDLSKELALWWQKRAEVMIQKKEAEKQEMEERVRKELADVPAERLHVEGNEKMEYFLIGVDKDKPVPESGYRLVVVMPGGDGSADFHPFVRRIWKYAMNESGTASPASQYIVAQPIAVRWTPNQQVVWATEKAKVEKQEFSTEVFVESVIADVAKRTKIDPKSVFTLSWSSSGPAAYAIALQDKTTITGSYILMSVFRPNEYALENAKDRLFAIQHSPEDRVCPFRMAKDAEEQLTKHGAVVKFTEYSGGHGWSGNIYGRIRENLDWLSHGSR